MRSLYATLLGSALLTALLPLAARAQTYNATILSLQGGILLQESNGIENAAAGQLENTGSIIVHLGPASQTLINHGRYSATSGGRDVFGGANGSLSGNVEVAGSTSPNFARLYFRNSGGTVAISNTSGLNVRDSLVVNADLITTVRASHTASALRLRSGAAYAWSGGGLSDTRHVNGYVTKTGSTAFTFPVGSGTDLRTLAINSGPAATDSISVAWIAGNPSTTNDPSDGSTHSTGSFAPALSGVSTAGYWDWVSSATGAVNVTVSIPNLTGFATADKLRLAGWNGTQWVSLSAPFSASGTAENSTLTGTVPAGITALGLGAGPNPLPVTLVSFTAASRQLDAVLNWRTATERNSASFVVERSLDGQSWEDVARVAAAGDSYTPREYATTDAGAGRLAKLIYYRLRQIDKDLTFTRSDIQTVTFDTKPVFDVTAYPVPMASTLNVRVVVSQPGTLDVLLYDVTGRTVRHLQPTATTGANALTLDVQDLPTGAYTLRVRQGLDATTIAVIKE